MHGRTYSLKIVASEDKATTTIRKADDIEEELSTFNYGCAARTRHGCQDSTATDVDVIIFEGDVGVTAIDRLTYMSL